MTDQEINEAVAKKLGYEIGCGSNGVSDGRIFEWRKGENCPDFVGPMPAYSTSIEAAWEVVDSLPKDIDFHLHILHSKVTCWFTWNTLEGMTMHDMMPEETADTAPLAICLAFLKLEGK